jgi:bifunctional DNA-binding transcriptional regulator/antitoxin component of YhaV-PrlF toxin-antitoxin module
MPSESIRKIIKFGQSGLVVTVPKAWARYYGLKPGDNVQIIANGEMIVKPKQTKDK